MKDSILPWLPRHSKLIQSKTWMMPVRAWSPPRTSLAISAVMMKDTPRQRTVSQAGSLDLTRNAAVSPQRTKARRGRMGMRAYQVGRLRRLGEAGAAEEPWSAGAAARGGGRRL